MHILDSNNIECTDIRFKHVPLSNIMYPTISNSKIIFRTEEIELEKAPLFISKFDTSIKHKFKLTNKKDNIPRKSGLGEIYSLFDKLDKFTIENEMRIIPNRIISSKYIPCIKSFGDYKQLIFNINSDSDNKYKIFYKGSDKYREYTPLQFSYQLSKMAKMNKKIRLLLEIKALWIVNKACYGWTIEILQIEASECYDIENRSMDYKNIKSYRYNGMRKKKYEPFEVKL